MMRQATTPVPSTEAMLATIYCGHAGEKCRVTGTYRILGVGEQKTYSIQTITDIGGSN
jgi:hypothetical protein